MNIVALLVLVALIAIAFKYPLTLLVIVGLASLYVSFNKDYVMKVLVVLSLLFSGLAYSHNKCNQEPPTDNRLAKMVKMINAERKARGLHALQVDPKLNCAAQMHSEDVGPKKLCPHEGTDGSSPWERAKKCGTKASRENIACGQGTPRAAVDAWLDSEGHYKNMMAENIKFIGVGVANNYWTNIFR